MEKKMRALVLHGLAIATISMGLAGRGETPAIGH
jgi:hypothetical protein